MSSPVSTTSAWTIAADRALWQASSAVGLLAAVTPQNLGVELERLERLWAAGQPAAPRFAYVSRSVPAGLADALSRIADVLVEADPLGGVYAGRARELACEAALCAAVGTSEFWEHARRRYAPRDAFDARADELAVSWLTSSPSSPADPHEPMIISDDLEDPRSLLHRIRAEVSQRRLPLRVVATPHLSALAAIGDGVIQIARGRPLSVSDIERTIVHELDGHAAPREAARALSLGIFAIGTARGSDDQEGRALAIERRAGYLDHGRRLELGLRHTAARCVEGRADFIETARALEPHGTLAQRLRISARAHRGGGLARESVYLPALLRVEATLEANPSADQVLASGRVAVPTVEILRPFAQEKLIPKGVIPGPPG